MGVLSALFKELIDPIQSENAYDDQIDRHCETHDPRRDQQKHSRGQRDNRQQGVARIEVHLGFISDSRGAAIRRGSPEPANPSLTAGRYGLNNRGETSPREQCVKGRR
jgi:hypothetical protein